MAKEQDDLVASVQGLTTAVTAVVAQIARETDTILANLANSAGGLDASVVEQSAQSINALAAQLTSAVTSAQTALNPPAAAPTDAAPAA